MKNNDYAETVGLYFMKLRALKDMTRADVAKETGRKQTWLYDIETGRSRISLYEADWLCHFYGKTLADLGLFINSLLDNTKIEFEQNSTEMTDTSEIQKSEAKTVADRKNLQPFFDKEIMEMLSEKKESQIAIGNALKTLRKSAGLSQAAAGKKCNHTSMWISDIEKGKTTISFYDLCRLSILYKFNMSQLEEALIVKSDLSNG